MADLLIGSDSVGFEDFCELVLNLMKNNWRGATIPTDAQPGMLFSRSTDDRLSHQASAQEYLIFQGAILCADNEILFADNEVLVTLPV